MFIEEAMFINSRDILQGYVRPKKKQDRSMYNHIENIFRSNLNFTIIKNDALYKFFLFFRKDGWFSQNFYINKGRSRSLFSDSYDSEQDAIESATFSSQRTIKPRSFQDDSSNLESLRDMLVGRSYDSG